MTTNNSVTRYSTAELEEFGNLIKEKIEKSEKQLQLLLDQIENINETFGSDGDMMDDTTNTNDLGMVQTMANRQRTHIRDLENALLRVKNKSYGICIITGELIDKRRLLAVLTTTKSLAAKNGILNPPKEKTVRKPVTSKNTPKSFSRIIKKTSPNPAPPKMAVEDEDDDDLFDDILGDDFDGEFNEVESSSVEMVEMEDDDDLD